MDIKDIDIEKMIELAYKAQEFSFSPYGHFKVGACVLTKSGKIYTGTNIEDASRCAGICAERVAGAKAVSEGETQFEAVVTTCCGDNYAYPCGVCRQFLSEFGTDMKIIAAKSKTDYQIFTLDELLTHRFKKKAQ